jgi:hypothetical protein
VYSGNFEPTYTLQVPGFPGFEVLGFTAPFFPSDALEVPLFLALDALAVSLCLPSTKEPLRADMALPLMEAGVIVTTAERPLELIRKETMFSLKPKDSM